MSEQKPKRAMNLNSLFMGADNIKPPPKKDDSDKAAVKPPTMASLARFESQSKIIEDKKETWNEPKTGVNKVSNGLLKLFDKAEENKKAQDDSSSFKINASNFKTSPGSKKARPSTARPSQKSSAFAKNKKQSSSESDSESDSKSGSGSESSKSSKSEEKEKERPKPNKNELIASDDSSSDSDEAPEVVNFGKINSSAMTKINPLTMVKYKNYKSKEQKEQNLKKLLDQPTSKQFNTPMMNRRRVLVTNQSGIAPSLNSKFGFQSLNRKEEEKQADPTKIEKPKNGFKFDLPINVFSKQSSVMTPNHTLDNSRKLLQMGGIGEYIMPVNKKSKDESDIKTKLTYVSQLKEDQAGLESWGKSFSEAINEVTVQNKEYLTNVDPKIQQMFKRIGTLTKKTVVFGLDGVLVKTSFAKEGPEWKQSELVLDKNKNQKMKIYVAFRPFVINTLKQLKRAGIEVILYSASQSNYTTAILSLLSKQRVEFHHIVWAEEHEKATKPKDGRPERKINTRNINIFLHNRTQKDIIVVDCKVQGFAYNITNGIYVPPFEGPPNDNNPNQDTFFMYLFEYLKTFNDVSDVRQKIQREFDIKSLFWKNFKNPAMDKLKSLVNNEKEKKETSAPEKWSTPKIETTFRRNSRVIQDYEEILKFQKYQKDLQMESITELPEKA